MGKGLEVMHKRVALVASLALLMAACGGSAGSSGESDSYRIGYIGILSGPNAGLGQAYQAGFENYFEALNASGGVNGREIDFITADDRGDPATGLSAYRNMVSSDGVLAVFGLIGSNVATGVQKVADSTGTPIVGTGVVSPATGSSFIAGLDPVNTLTDEVPLLEHLMKKEGVANPRIATVASDTVSGHSSVDRLKEMVEPLGMSVIGSEYTPIDLTQFSTQAAAIASKKPDAVAVAVTASSLSIVAKALRQAGIDVPIVNYWVGASDQLLSELGDPEIYVYRDYADPTEDAAAAMRKSAKEQGVSDGTEFSSGNYYTQGYVMAQLAESVLEACGEDCTPESFSDALETKASAIDTAGLTGTEVGFSADNHVFLHEVRYFHWDPAAGKSVPVEGLPNAEATASNP